MLMSPHLEMVAGVTFLRLSVSRMRQVPSDKVIDSPFGRFIFLLSSKIEFRFSTHSWSIGPSRLIHFLVDVVSLENALK